ncbi:MAG TPA: O-antigen ligase family protein [Candidatus Paceibacterota bacterium]|nr:O-antigen ligase family protein [Candidatus Paceibacterota bacterium]
MKEESLLAKILRYSIYAVAFMPLIIFSQYISPFHFGKVVVFRSIVEFMAVIYLLLIWRERKYIPKYNHILGSIILFTLVFSISTLLGVQKYFSFWGTLERMGGLWTFFHFVAFFIMITSVLRSRQHWHTFLNLTIFASVLSSFYGFGQKTSIQFFIGSGNRERIFGTIGNAALFAGYEIVNLFLALTLFFRPENSPGKRWFYALAFFIDTIAVLMTVVRGSILGLGVGFIVFAVLYYLQFHSKLAKRFILTLAVMAGIFILVLITPIRNASFIVHSRFLARLTDTSFDSFTAKTRFWAWAAGLKGWRENPKTILIGWGPESFNIPFSKYFNPKFFTGLGSETFFDRAHNMFVEILVTMGLFGLLAYIYIFIAAFSSLNLLSKNNPSQRIYAIGLISLLIAYIIHNSFIFDTSANLLVFFTVLGFIYSLGRPNELGTKQIVQIVKTSWLQIPVGIVLAVLAIILVYRTNVLPSKANYATTRGIIRGWANDFPGAVAKFKESVSYDVPGKYEFRNRFAQYLLEYASGKPLTPELTDALQFAIGEVKKNTENNSLDYLPLLYLSRLNITLGKDNPKSPYNDIALDYSLKALKISPTFVRTYYEVGQAYLNKNDYADAIAYFRKAAELNPNVGISYWYWGITEYESGNKQTGLELINMALDKGASLAESDYIRLVNIYAPLNNIPKLVQLYENLVTIAPQKAQYRASLAVAYAKAGRIDDAIESARMAVKLDPSFLKDAQAFARSLGREL